MCTNECTHFDELMDGDETGFHCFDCPDKECQKSHHHCSDCGYYFEEEDLFDVYGGFLYTCKWCSPDLQDPKLFALLKRHVQTPDDDPRVAEYKAEYDAYRKEMRERQELEKTKFRKAHGIE